MGNFLDALFKKLSSYQLFNFIVPGALFLGILKFLFDVDIQIDNNIWWFMLASYITGISLSRFGSIVIEGFLLKGGIIKDYDVRKYLQKKKDYELIEMLLELTNLYRTLCALFTVLFLITFKFKDPCECHWFLTELSLAILFGLSFYKQYNYFLDSINNGD